MKISFDINNISDLDSKTWAEVIPFISSKNFLDELTNFIFQYSKQPTNIAKKNVENYFKMELALIRNPHLSENAMIKFTQHKNKFVRSELASQPHITMYVRNLITKDNDINVIKVLKKNSPLSYVDNDEDFMKNFIKQLAKKQKH